MFTFHRIVNKAIQWKVKRGRKFQVLPKEEEFYTDFLNHMAVNNMPRKEQQFLDDVHHWLERNGNKSAFAGNRPGQNNFELNIMVDCCSNITQLH